MSDDNHGAVSAITLLSVASEYIMVIERRKSRSECFKLYGVYRRVHISMDEWQSFGPIFHDSWLGDKFWIVLPRGVGPRSFDHSDLALDRYRNGLLLSHANYSTSITLPFQDTHCLKHTLLPTHYNSIISFNCAFYPTSLFLLLAMTSIR